MWQRPKATANSVFLMLPLGRVKEMLPPRAIQGCSFDTCAAHRERGAEAEDLRLGPAFFKDDFALLEETARSPQLPGLHERKFPWTRKLGNGGEERSQINEILFCFNSEKRRIGSHSETRHQGPGVSTSGNHWTLRVMNCREGK